MTMDDTTTKTTKKASDALKISPFGQKVQEKYPELFELWSKQLQLIDLAMYYFHKNGLHFTQVVHKESGQIHCVLFVVDDDNRAIPLATLFNDKFHDAYHDGATSEMLIFPEKAN